MSKYDLSLEKPLMNAAGSLGYTPDLRGPIELTQLGAFVTNPVSLKARTPAHGTRMLSFPGGFLLHTGHPNRGLEAVIRRYRTRWARSPVPVLVHILAQGVEEVAEMVQRLENLEGVMGVEIGLSSEVDANTAAMYIQAAMGELPVVARLPIERARELIYTIAGTEVAAVSLGPARGALPNTQGQLIHGRIYGPGVLPQALATVKAITQLDVPVIGAGGVYTPQDIQAMQAAGAMAVRLDAVLWRNGVPGES
ncbi:MAG: hypothetical protein KAJ53_02960 [Anaerolineales bacterium]|nr:hypothetical protein [Anaerolineales bacterium]